MEIVSSFTHPHVLPNPTFSCGTSLYGQKIQWKSMWTETSWLPTLYIIFNVPQKKERKSFTSNWKGV